MRRKNKIVDVFPILLFLIFTLSALGIVTFSVQIYRNIVEQAEGRFDTETAAAYITEKFRNHDNMGSIEVADFEGNDAITLAETVKDVSYITYIYVYDGYLRELYVETAELGNYTAESGNEILPMESLDIEQVTDRLVRISLVDDEGRSEEAYLSKKSVKGTWEGVSDDGIAMDDKLSIRSKPLGEGLGGTL